MKLKTKLIPLAGAAAVCATVAPITLTACGSSAIGKTVNLLKDYKPSGVQHDYQYMTFKEVYDDYRIAVEDDKDVFIQDFIWGKQQLVKKLLKKPNYTFTNIELSVDSFKINKTQQLKLSVPVLVWDEEAGEYVKSTEIRTLNVPTYSFSFNFTYDVEINDTYFVENANKSKPTLYHVDVDEEFKNVPFLVWTLDATKIQPPIGITSNWFVTPFFTWLAEFYSSRPDDVFSGVKPEACSIKRTCKMTETRIVETSKGNIEQVIEDELSRNLLSSDIVNWSNEDKWLFQNLTLPEIISSSSSDLITETSGTANSWYLQSVAFNPIDDTLQYILMK